MTKETANYIMQRMTKLLLTAPFVRKHSVSAVRKLSVCMPTPFPEST